MYPVKVSQMYQIRDISGISASFLGSEARIGNSPRLPVYIEEDASTEDSRLGKFPVILFFGLLSH